MSNLAVRQAVQLALNEEDMLFAAFGNKEFYKLNGDLYPEGYPWATSLGGKVYNKADTAAAKLLDGANVADKKIRILTSQQYEFHYKMALVAAEYLKAAGFTVDMQVVDWATLTQRRQDPAVWDIFITHSVFLPEPALIDFPSKDAPGWWDTPRRAQVMDAYNQARTQEERVKRWADVQQAVYDEIPSSRSGTSTPRARARRRCRAQAGAVAVLLECLEERQVSDARGGGPVGPPPRGNAPSFRLDLGHHRVALSLEPAGRAGGRDVHRRDHRVRDHPHHAGRSGRRHAGPQASQQDIDALRAQLGLDQPFAVQYVGWLGKLVQGDLGQSIFMNKPVLSALADRAEPTLLLTLMSLIIASAIALPVGILSAVKRGTTLDQSVLSFSMFTSSVPSFWLGLLLMQVFSVKLGWLPVAGYGGPDASLATRLSHLILPAVVLGLVNSALITRFIRASMLDVLRDDYVRTARAKGLPEGQVILKHAVRNALIPILTVLGLTTALLISGAVVTETVFGLPGVGSLVVSAVLRRDYPVIQGALLIIAAIYVLINLFIDLLYLLVDPASAIDGKPTPQRCALPPGPLRGMPADRQSRLRGIPMGRSCADVVGDASRFGELI